METQKIQLGNEQTENSNNLIFSSLVSFCLLLYTIFCMHAQSLSHVRLFVIPWTVVDQAPLPVGFPRQEYRSGLPRPSPKDWTHVSCTGRQILYHWATRDAPTDKIINANVVNAIDCNFRLLLKLMVKKKF